MANNAKRFNVIPTARRVGKSEMIWRARLANGRLPLIMPVLKGWPVGLFTHEIKDVENVWNGILEIYEPLIIRKDNTKHIVNFVGGGTLEVWSIANVGRQEAGRGRKYKRIVVDEMQKIDDDVCRYWWQNAIRPTLMDYQGDAFFLGNPNGRGTFFHELARRGGGGKFPDMDVIDGDWKDWGTFRFPTSSNPLIPADEIEQARSELDALSFAQEIEGMFVNYAGEVWCYQIKDMAVQKRVFRSGLRVEKQLPIIFSFDFNKRPMTAVAVQFPPLAMPILSSGLYEGMKYGARFLKEFRTNIATEASIYDTCQLIREWVFSVYGVKIGKWTYPNGKEEVFACSLPVYVTGDASGDTGDGRQKVPQTYYDIICDELGLRAQLSVRVPNKNPLHADSYIKVNTWLKSNTGLEIDVKECPFLQKDILTVKSDKFRGIDKSDASKSHLLDCFRYGIHSFG